jgi:hypothetical protein
MYSRFAHPLAAAAMAVRPSPRRGISFFEAPMRRSIILSMLVAALGISAGCNRADSSGRNDAPVKRIDVDVDENGADVDVERERIREPRRDVDVDINRNGVDVDVNRRGERKDVDIDIGGGRGVDVDVNPK